MVWYLKNKEQIKFIFVLRLQQVRLLDIWQQDRHGHVPLDVDRVAIQRHFQSYEVSRRQPTSVGNDATGQKEEVRDNLQHSIPFVSSTIIMNH